jgi:hypothetical protein
MDTSADIGNRSFITKAYIKDIEDLIPNISDFSLKRDVVDSILTRGWTAKPKKVEGKFVLVNMLNQDFANKSIIVIGDTINGRIPIRTEDGNEVLIRHKNLAHPTSYAAKHTKTGKEAKIYLEQVASESGRISSEDVKKINTSSPCSCGSCAHACWIEPGIYTPRQILDMIERGILDPSNIVLDFYSTPGRQGVGILRPRTVEELGLSLAPFTPIPGIPCIHLGQKGCVLNRDEMPTNCKAFHCDEQLNVSINKHSSAYELWDTPEGRQVVAWFQSQILARDPSAPTTEEYYIMQTFLTKKYSIFGFAHKLGCVKIPDMIKMARDIIKEMMLFPEPEIIDIIKMQLEIRLKYANNIEKILLSNLQNSLLELEVFMAKK